MLMLRIEDRVFVFCIADSGVWDMGYVVMRYYFNSIIY